MLVKDSANAILISIMTRHAFTHLAKDSTVKYSNYFGGVCLAHHA